VTKRSYNFAKKCNIPIYFTSAASGVNVVKVYFIEIFKETISLAVAYKDNPPDSYIEDVLGLLKNVTFT